MLNNKETKVKIMIKPSLFTQFLEERSRLAHTDGKTIKVDYAVINHLTNYLKQFYPALEDATLPKKLEFFIFLLEKSLKEKEPRYETAFEKSLLRKRKKIGRPVKCPFTKNEENIDA